MDYFYEAIKSVGAGRGASIVERWRAVLFRFAFQGRCDTKSTRYRLAATELLNLRLKAPR
jgi:hypothetical protein